MTSSEAESLPEQEARQELVPESSRVSLTTATVAPYRLPNPWWKFWKRHKFGNPELEALFERYIYKFQYSSLRCMLVLLLILTLSLAVLNFVFVSHISVENISNVMMCVIFVIFLVYIHTKYMQPGHLVVVSFGLLFVCVCFAVLSLPVNYQGRPLLIFTPAEGVWRIALIILLTYIFLPLPLYVGVVTGMLLSIVHTAVSIFEATSYYGLLWRQVRI